MGFLKVFPDLLRLQCPSCPACAEGRDYHWQGPSPESGGCHKSCPASAAMGLRTVPALPASPHPLRAALMALPSRQPLILGLPSVPVAG